MPATPDEQRRPTGRGSRERAAQQRAAARAQARRRTTITVAAGTIAVVVAVVVAIVLTSGHHTSGGGTAASDPGIAGSGSTACTYSPAGQAAKDVGTPPAKGVAPSTYHATISTNDGTLEIALDGAKAPCTVNSFVYLAAKGYFAGTSCHRLTTSGIYVLQCGDPTGTGSGGPGYQFGDENLAGATYPAGTVAMANAGPGTNGSQFFLVYRDTSLPPNYTPFGRITSGLDVLTSIAAKGTDNANGPDDGHPKQSVKIRGVSVTR
jgi:peptidyl-prolyl cis-trans isomerase B (cyclophilin B)